MEYQNNFLREINLVNVLGNVRPDGLTDEAFEQQVRRDFLDRIPEDEEEELNRLWALKLEEIKMGHEWAKTICHIRRCSPLRFATAVKDLPWWRDDLTQQQKNKIETRVTQINSIVKNWPKIVMNVTLPEMEWVDVRRFTLNQIMRSSLYTFVEKYNRDHNPNKKRKLPTAPLFTREQLTDMVENRNGATNRLLAATGSNHEQLKMFSEQLVMQLQNYYNENRNIFN